MKLALTLSKYISKQFIFYFLIVFGIFAVLTSLIDLLELLRRAADKSIPFYVILNMVILKFPLLIQKIMPFIVLVAAVLAYSNLARRSELIVIRSAGVSVWEFLLPAVLTAFILGIFVMTVINPISAIMMARNEQMSAKYFENKKSALEISETGLWLRQQYEVMPMPDGSTPKNEMIIHGRTISDNKNIKLKDIEILIFDEKDKFLFRIDSNEAILVDSQWHITDATITNDEDKNSHVNSFYIGTILKKEDIKKTFADPDLVSFWQLPAFINKLEESGFSALAHIMQLHKIISAPFFYSAMVLIGAIFSLKAPRQGMVGYSITLSVVFGFLIYFSSNLVSSFGLSGSMPIIFSAWMPIFISGLMGIGMLLHLEDG